MPTPVSLTDSTVADLRPGSSARATRMRMVPPSGMASTALRSRFQITWRICPAAPSMPAVGSTLDHHLDVGRALLVLEGLGDLARDLGQVERLLLLGAGAGVFEQVGDQPVEPVHLAHGDVDQLAALAVRPRRPPQHLDRSRDAGQRVADLVGDARGQPADRGQPLGALHLDLHPPQLGQVLEVDDPADDLAGVIGQRRRRDAQVAHAAVGPDGVDLVPPHRARPAPPPPAPG